MFCDVVKLAEYESHHFVLVIQTDMMYVLTLFVLADVVSLNFCGGKSVSLNIRTFLLTL